MGIGRMLWRSTSIGRIIDTTKNVVDEGNLIEGLKRTAKEDYCEDNPLTKVIYESGKYDAKIEGYAEASEEYENKLLKQADELLKQTRIFESEKNSYEILLDEYEKEIYKLEEKINRTETENEYLQQLLLRERRLRKMAS